MAIQFQSPEPLKSEYHLLKLRMSELTAIQSHFIPSCIQTMFATCYLALSSHYEDFSVSIQDAVPAAAHAALEYHLLVTVSIEAGTGSAV